MFKGDQSTSSTVLTYIELKIYFFFFRMYELKITEKNTGIIFNDTAKENYSDILSLYTRIQKADN